ncbi:hypothetical protein MCEMRE196_01328 [Candidatus Nanopelagicaceae bacterium]
MEIYLYAVVAITALNALPAFAPPTWMVLIFFLINYDANPIALVVLGVISATTGRALLAWYFRKFAHFVPTRFSRNMEYAGKYFENKPEKRYAILALFLISPVSSAQLFEAAGMMKTIGLKPLLTAFAIGRTISYSTYVTGAAALAATSFGEVLIAEIKSPWAITIQILMIAGLIALGLVDWKSKLHRHRK